MMTNSSKDLDKAQNNQKHIGAAESDPETTSPADKFRYSTATMIVR